MKAARMEVRTPAEQEIAELMEALRKQLQENPDAEQIVGVKTVNNNLYFAVNRDIRNGDYQKEKELFNALRKNRDRQVAYFVTMWNDQTPDMCSHNFRKGLLQLDPENKNAMTVLRGAEKYYVKPLSSLLPPKKQRSERKKNNEQEKR